MYVTISMLPYSSSKEARLSGVAARTASRISEEHDSPTIRSVRVKNISAATSIWSKTRMLPSLSLRITPSLWAPRSRRLRRPRNLPIASLLLPLLQERLQLLQLHGYLFLLPCLQRDANGTDIRVDGLDGNGRHVRQQFAFE